MFSRLATPASGVRKYSGTRLVLIDVWCLLCNGGIVGSGEMGRLDPWHLLRRCHAPNVIMKYLRWMNCVWFG
eukprot:3687803-Pyramimonas_sp.AAC.1